MSRRKWDNNRYTFLCSGSVIFRIKWKSTDHLLADVFGEAEQKLEPHLHDILRQQEY